MSETKLEVKKWGPSEKFSLASEISLASENSWFRLSCEISLCLPVNSFLNVFEFFEFFLNFR